MTTWPRRRLAPMRLIGAAAVVLILVASGRPSTQTVPEHALKAAYLNNFAKFTEWPADALKPGAPLTLCVFNDPAVGDWLTDLTKGRPVDGHDLVVLSKPKVEGAFVSACHLLYVSGFDGKQSSALLAAVKGQAILTVSDASKFGQAGGVVQLFVEGSSVRFAVNVEAAQRARLRLSSKLLSFAKLVKDDPNGLRH